MGSKCHTNCHQATSRCMSQVVRQRTGYQAQGPTYSRLGPGLFSDAQRLPLGLVFKDSGKARPTSRGHKSPSGEPKQTEPHGGRAGQGLEAWLVGGGRVQGPSPGCWSRPLGTHASQRPLLSFPGLCPTQALARKRQAELGRPPQDLGDLPGANEAIYTSGHSTADQYVFKRFLPK